MSMDELTTAVLVFLLEDMEKEVEYLEDLTAVLIATMEPSRRIWVHPLYKDRPEKGAFTNLIRDLQEHNKYHEYFRMSKMRFDEVLERVQPYIRLGSHYTRIFFTQRISIVWRSCVFSRQ